MLKLKLQYFGHLLRRVNLLEKTLMLGKIEGKKRRGETEDEMIGWHHLPDQHEVGDLQELMMDREAVHGITKSWTRLINELN